MEGYIEPSTHKSKWVRSEIEGYEANLKALSVLHHALSSDDLCRIGTLKAAQEAWDLIEKIHGCVSISLRDEMLLSEEQTSLRS